jgi:hypothetical protein
MKSGDGAQNRTWWSIGIASVVVFVGILLLLSYRGSGDANGIETKRSLEATKIVLTRLAQQEEGRVVAEESQFFDPTPLFLPTEWNSDQKPLPPSVLNDPGEMFARFPSKLQFAEDGVALKFKDPIQTPDKPSDTINVIENELAFRGMGRGDVEVGNLAARGGYLVVKSADGSKRAIVSQILADARPPMDNWKPMEFLAVVNRAGLVGSLSLIERSGFESVDLYFQNYLVQTFRLGEYLAPGFYRISVGP